ncbi:MAG: hypothetical protein GY805_18080 [Chloroflexi bacterium]|nr:hypothetical protein [Chloroflexota bacterium]
MNRTWKLLLFIFAGMWLLAACTTPADVTEAVPELAAAVPEEVVVVDPVTAVPPIPTEETVAEATEIEADVVVETAVEEENDEIIEPPPSQTVNQYTNVSYTEADADVIGRTDRAQFVLAYSTW